MKRFTMCLLTITLFLSCLAQDITAKKKDCTTQHSKGSFVTPLFKPCTGDDEIFVTINFNLTVKQCIEEDGRVTTRMHFQYHGTGIGSTTGNEYVLNAQERDITTTTPTCEFSMIQTFHQVLISKGSQPNERLLSKTTFIVNSDCQPSFTEEFEAICK